MIPRLSNPVHRVRGLSGDSVLCPSEAERARDLERRNRELNDRRVAMGRMTRAEADAQEARFNADDPSSWDKELAVAFLEGAGDGLQCFPEAFRNALNAAAGWSLRLVPWWVWVGAGVAGLAYLGVFDGLKGSLSTRRKA